MIGPTGCTKINGHHLALPPRIWPDGRRTRSAAAVAVNATSTAATPTNAPRWPGRRSLHRRPDSLPDRLEVTGSG